MKTEETIVSGIIIDDDKQLTFYEICETCHIDESEVNELVDYGVLSPEGESQKEWHFSGVDLERVQKAQRLKHDLEINLAGIALALDLMDEIDQLREKLARLERK